MKTDLIHVPFEPGLSDAVDPVHAGGKLRTAQNVRFRKLGRAAKKFGTVGVTLPTMSYSPSRVSAIAEWQGSRVLVQNGLVHQVNGATAGGTTAWKTFSNHLLSPWLPVRRDPIGRSEMPSFGAHRCDCATIGSVTMFVWEEGGYTYMGVQLADGSIPIRKRVTSDPAEFPRIIAATSTSWYIVWQEANLLKARTLLATDYSFGTVNTLATLSSSTGKWSVCDIADDSGDWLVLYQSAATTIRLSVRDGTATGFSETAGINITTTGTLTGVDVGPDDVTFGSVVWVAWNNTTSANAEVKNLVSTSSVTHAAGPVALYSTPHIVQGAPGIARSFVDPAMVTIVWGGEQSTFLRSFIMHSVVTSTATINQGPFTSWHVKPITKPFLVNNNDNVKANYVWVTEGADLPANTDFGNQVFLVNLLNPHRVVMYVDQVQSLTLHDFELGHMGKSTVRGAEHIVAIPVIQRSHPAGAGTVTLGVDALVIEEQKSSVLASHRDWVAAGRALYFAGGLLTEFTGAPYEAGFILPPVAIGATVIAGGSVTVGLHSWKAVREWIDPQGRRHRSAPSNPVSATTTAGNQQVGIEITLLSFGKTNISTAEKFSESVIHVYRTNVGGTTYYRVTPENGAPLDTPSSSSPTVTWYDTNADNATREVLYTDGVPPVFENWLPPASRYTAEGGGRVWLAGGFEQRQVAFSKLMIDVEPAQFVDDDTFRLWFPEPVTGLTWADGGIVVFSEDSIYSVFGDGPDDQGNGSFTEPRRLPSDVGCISHESIVEVPDGWLFQSKRGFFLLPRGLGPPVFVGADVQSELLERPTVLSAVRVQQQGSRTVDALGEVTVQYLVADASSGDSRVIVYDVALRRWVSVDYYGEQLGHLGVWDDKLVIALRGTEFANGLRIEDYATFGNVSAVLETHLRLADLRPFGLLGFGQVAKVHLFGEYRGDACLDLLLAIDGEDQPSMLTHSLLSTEYSQGERFYHEFAIPKSRGNSWGFELRDSEGFAFLATESGETIVTEAGEPIAVEPGSGATEGLVYHGLALEVIAEQGTKRLPAAQRA